MKVARVIDASAPNFAVGDRVAVSFGDKTCHTADPARDLLIQMPADFDPVLGIFAAQMGPIATNGIRHADALEFGAQVSFLGAGVAGRPVLVWGGSTVGLLTALFARAAGATEVLAAEFSLARQRDNDLAIACAQINRVPRPLAATWDRRRLAHETLRLLALESDAIRRHTITHVVPYEDAPAFLHDLVAHPPDFLQIVFEQAPC